MFHKLIQTSDTSGFHNTYTSLVNEIKNGVL